MYIVLFCCWDIPFIDRESKVVIIEWMFYSLKSYEDRYIAYTDTSTDTSTKTSTYELSTLYTPKQCHKFLEVVYAEIWYVQVLR